MRDMKNIIKCFAIIFLCLLTGKSFAQAEGIKVEYKGIFNTDNPIEITGFLYAISSNAIYEIDFSTRKKLNEPVPPPDGVITWEYTPSLDNDLYAVDFTSHIVNNFDWIMAGNKSKITDKVLINWKLVNEKRNIDGIECYKATTHFRGRNWEAWYAPSISYSAGPRKFHGLPGLIIEISDEAKRYNFVATKIESMTESLYEYQLAKFQNIEYNQEQTLMEYVKIREEVLENRFADIEERGTQIISKTSKHRNGMELIYEWEEEKK